MGLMNKFNKGGIDWGIETKDLPYRELKEYNVGDTIVIKGLFINRKGNFDDHPVAIIDGALLDLPSHLHDAATEILADSEVVEAIKDGKVGVKVRSYDADKFGKKDLRSVEWIDIE